MVRWAWARESQQVRCKTCSTDQHGCFAAFPGRRVFYRVWGIPNRRFADSGRSKPLTLLILQPNHWLAMHGWVVGRVRRDRLIFGKF